MAQYHHTAAPFIMPPLAEVNRRRYEEWAEAVVRRELKRSLSRMGIPFDINDSTATLGMLQEAAHQLRSH